MKFQIKQTILLHSLNSVIRGVSTKNLIPILGCIKFSLNNKGLILASTDNELSIEVIIEKDKFISELEGDFVINGRLFYELVKKISKTDIYFEYMNGGKLKVSTSTSSYSLNTNNIFDFPDLEFDISDEKIEIKNKIFKNMINKTLFATSLSETRPVLTGFNLKNKNGYIISTTTDSYRLAKYSTKITSNLEVDVIIPQRTINELSKILGDNESVFINIFNNKIMFEIGNLKLVSRLINGTYPNTDKLIPIKSEILLKVNLLDFYNAIDRASLLTTEIDKNTIKMENIGNKIIIRSTIKEIGNVEEILNCNNIFNKNINIAFSSKFMLDSLKSFDSTEIILNFNSPTNPIIISSEMDESNIQLILPIRTY